MPTMPNVPRSLLPFLSLVLLPSLLTAQGAAGSHTNAAGTSHGAGAPSADPRAAMQRTARERMERFDWLAGQWEGPATIYSGARTITLTQRETVQRSAMQTALIIQGRGAMSTNGTEREVFAAAGVLTYDVPSARYLFFSASGTGQAQQFSVELTGEQGLIWGFTTPTGERTRYTILRTSADAWYELGETSRDGGVTWTRSLEMTLTRVKP